MSINPNAVVMLVNTPMEALDGVYRVQVSEGNVTDLKRLNGIVDNRKDFIIEGGELLHGYYVSELFVTGNFLRLRLVENFCCFETYLPIGDVCLPLYLNDRIWRVYFIFSCRWGY